MNEQDLSHSLSSLAFDMARARVRVRRSAEWTSNDSVDNRASLSVRVCVEVSVCVCVSARCLPCNLSLLIGFPKWKGIVAVE